MKPSQIVFFAVIGFWMAGGCQATISPHLGLGGLGPDFPLIVVAVLGLGGTRRAGTLLGFTAGVLTGALAGANMASYAVTRTLAGFLCGWLTSLEFEPNPMVAGLLAMALTLFAQVGLMFISPPPAIVPFLLATIGSSVVNGVLAMPLHVVLRRLTGAPVRPAFHMK